MFSRSGSGSFPAMTLRILFLTALLSSPALAASPCSGEKTELLILGDSQTGSYWASSYFGNFIQKCLTNQGSSFVSYARGGTQPAHWMTDSGLDRIETVFRSPAEPHLNLGVDSVPTCKKRLDQLIGIHEPSRVLLFFGDNLLSANTDEIRKQFREMIGILDSKGIRGENCILLTPTYEMAVASKRNVPSKNLENTLKVLRAVQTEVAARCRIINGLEIMKDSPLLKGDILAREAVEGTSGCFGPAANDNIHYCGKAAQELAEKVCETVTGNSKSDAPENGKLF